MSVDITAVETFGKTLSAGAAIVTPTSPDYKASLKRWSAAAEKAAVRLPSPSFDALSRIRF